MTATVTCCSSIVVIVSLAIISSPSLSLFAAAASPVSSDPESSSSKPPTSTSTSSSPQSSCMDLRPKGECPNHARHGECLANPAWMNVNCKRSCGHCDNVDGEECTDKHTACPLWATELECFTNPGYTHHACRKSCGLCVDVSELQERRKRKRQDEEDGGGGEVDDEGDIEHRIRYSQTDWGVWQVWDDGNDNSIGDDESPTSKDIRRTIQQMGKYQLSLTKVGRGTACNNLRHECARWATPSPGKISIEGTGTNRCESDVSFMIRTCSLACQYCHVVEEFHKCRNTLEKARQDPKNHVFFSSFSGDDSSSEHDDSVHISLRSIYHHLIDKTDGSVNLLPLSSSSSSSSKANIASYCDVQLASVSVADDNGNGDEKNYCSNRYHHKSHDEWLLSLNWSSIWDNDEGYGRRSLLNFLKSVPDNYWIDATDLPLWDDQDIDKFPQEHEHRHNAAAVMPITPRRSGRVLKQSSFLVSSTETPAVMEDFLKSVSRLLSVPEKYLEVEFVHYKHGERYAPHTDYRVHDLWRHSGIRLLSMYVVLSNATRGGSIGFPELDWVIVDEPQVLVWPNVVVQEAEENSGSDDVFEDDLTGGRHYVHFYHPLPKMKNEQLPVADGELYAARIWVREYLYDSSNQCS